MAQSDMKIQSFNNKIKNAIRTDRAFSIVWKASRTWTIFGACLTLIQGVLPLLTLYLLKLIIDTITLAIQSGDTEGSFSRVTYFVIAAADVAIIQSACRHAGEYVTETQSAVVTDYVTRMVHDKSLTLDLAYYENSTYYDTLHRAQQQGAYRSTRIVTGLTKTLQSTVSLTAMVGLLFMFHWSVGLLLFISVLPGIFVQILHAKKRFIWQKKRTSDERRARYFSNILTPYSGAKIYKIQRTHCRPFCPYNQSSLFDCTYGR